MEKKTIYVITCIHEYENYECMPESFLMGVYTSKEEAVRKLELLHEFASSKQSTRVSQYISAEWIETSGWFEKQLLVKSKTGSLFVKERYCLSPEWEDAITNRNLY
jgi:hypothetical protein